MLAPKPLEFPPFKLDLESEQLWRGPDKIPLRPKAFAVLRYLVERPGRLVSRDELVQAVWGETKVSEGVLRGCLREIRQALEDSVGTPRFIETVPRRGWRFITPLSPAAQPVSSVKCQVPSSKADSSPATTSHTPHPTPFLVGREAELTQLQGYLERATNGERQLVFVTGEPGIGKTTLIDAFVASLVIDPHIWLAHGQCVEHYGVGEAYLPVLAALEHLGRTVSAELLVEPLHRYAPMWLVQMPSLLRPEERATLQRELVGTTRERMLRELAVLLEELTVARTVVFVLEDLHWSDVSTLELLGYLARRRMAGRLLVLATYRTDTALRDSHPLPGLIAELRVHGQCQDLALERLSAADVEEYLRQRFPASVLPTWLAQVLHQRTEGNPLFLVNVVGDLITQGFLQQVEGSWALQGGLVALEERMPESLRQFVAQQGARLSTEERQTLEAASIAGTEFSAAAVAAALETDTGAVEGHCEDLTRRQQFLRRAGISEWPDGTQAARYGYRHALYQQWWHEQVTVTQRQQWHRRIGERLEAAYGQRTSEIAAELAVHFEQGGDYRRTVQYLGRAGQNALRRSAYHEAISYLTEGLKLLQTVPDSPKRTQQELILQSTLGPALLTIKGYGAREVERAYSRALTLCQQMGETPWLSSTLVGLHVFYLEQAELQTARALAEQQRRLAEHTQDPTLLLSAQAALGATFFYLGEPLIAHGHLEQSVALYDLHKHRFLDYADAIGPACRCWLAICLCYLGFLDQARQRAQEALTLAQESRLPYSVVIALDAATVVSLNRGEPQAAHKGAEAMIALSHEQEFAYWLARGTLWKGYALVAQGQREEGFAQIRQGYTALLAVGSEIQRTFQSVPLALACGAMGQIQEGLQALAEALAFVERTGARCSEAAMYQVKGELLLQQASSQGQRATIVAEAEACFHKAIAIARQQGAKALELQAVLSLGRLWQRQGKRDQAWQMLTEIYGWFTEGFDTADLREAKTLLNSLE